MVKAILSAVADSADQAAAHGDAGSAFDASSSSAGHTLSASQGVDLLTKLVDVPRFDMSVMSISSKERAVVKDMWDKAMDAANLGLKGQLQSLRPKYRV